MTQVEIKRTGRAVDSIPTDRPEIILVAGPVTEASAIRRTYIDHCKFHYVIGRVMNTLPSHIHNQYSIV